MTTPPLFLYAGPNYLRETIERALQQVVDPEVAMSILDVGLVRAVEVQDRRVHVVMTMTSPACPVSDVILDEVREVLLASLPAPFDAEVDLVWEPPWSTEDMSPRARKFMGW